MTVHLIDSIVSELIGTAEMRQVFSEHPPINAGLTSK
jgi:hypothetical protein